MVGTPYWAIFELGLLPDVNENRQVLELFCGKLKRQRRGPT